MSENKILVDKQLVQLAITICDAAIENAQELVAKHDSELGRTTNKNKWIGNKFDQDIIDANICKKELQNLLF